MNEYCIQKPDPILKGRWTQGFGINARSYPKANTDDEAISIFRETVKKCRTPYRLIRFVGFGYNVQVVVLDEVNTGHEGGKTK